MRNEARIVGDRVILLRDGRVDGSGDVEELLGAAGSGSMPRPERGDAD
jgi:ABC-type molybdate transport system ATPase subunit